jgi:hypothetical protein
MKSPIKKTSFGFQNPEYEFVELTQEQSYPLRIYATNTISLGDEDICFVEDPSYADSVFRALETWLATSEGCAWLEKLRTSGAITIHLAE